MLASCGLDGFVRLWNGQGRELAALKTPAQMLNSVAFAPDGKLLVAGSEEGVLYAWKLGNGVARAAAAVRTVAG